MDCTDTRLTLLERVAGQLWSATCRLQRIVAERIERPRRHRYTAPPRVVPADPTWGQVIRVTRTRSVTVTVRSLSLAHPAAAVTRSRAVAASVRSLSLARPSAAVTRVRGVLASVRSLTVARPSAVVTTRTRSVAVSVTVLGTTATNIVGAYLWYFSATPPTGYLLCNGGTFSSVTYPALASLIGDTFGPHSGTTYYLPDQRGRSILCGGSGSGLTTRSPGQSGGAEEVTLGAGQYGAAPHTHLAPVISALTGGGVYGNPNGNFTCTSTPQAGNVTSANTDPGATVPVPTMGPWLCVGYLHVRALP